MRVDLRAWKALALLAVWILAPGTVVPALAAPQPRRARRVSHTAPRRAVRRAPRPVVRPRARRVARGFASRTPRPGTRRTSPSSTRRPAGKVVAKSPPHRSALKAQLTSNTKKIQRAKAQLTEVRHDIRNAQDQLRVKKAQVARLTDQVRELQVQVEEAASRLSVTKKRLVVAEQRVMEATIRLQRAERRLAAHRRRLSVRIARSYTAGTVTFVDVLLRARSLDDFLDRQYYVERIFTSDMDFLTDLRAERRLVAERRAELERKRNILADAKEELWLQLDEIQGIKEAREQLLHRVETEKNLKEEELLEMQQDSQSIAAMLSQEWRRRQELWRQWHRTGRGVSWARWSGSWLRPVPFPISSGFGMRFHPILGYARLHSGIDFAAPEGTPIRAAADGEVLWASWRGGYGRCIILLHGGGVATLYGHCSDLTVHVGQEVKRGEVIGYTGNTGLSTGPHLHFEMRLNGQPVNPIRR